jgi:NADH-ubiquinone oxidoreductase chain 5
VYYQREFSRNAGIITVLSNRIGDVGILIGIVFIVEVGTWDIYFYRNRDIIMTIVGIIVLLGAITKSAQVPFSA